MEGIVQWVKNITYYLLFVSLLSYLMPAGKYEKYVKLFFGAVFILLVINPLTGDLHLDTSLARAYEKIRFAQEQEEFQQRVWGIEEQQIKQIMAQYEDAVTQDIWEMAEEAGFSCISAGARIEERKEEERFGQVVEIALVLGGEEKNEEGKGEGIEEGGIGENSRLDSSVSEEEDQAQKAAAIEKIQVVIGQEDRAQWEMQQQQGQDMDGKVDEEQKPGQGKENVAGKQQREKEIEEQKQQSGKENEEGKQQREEERKAREEQQAEQDAVNELRRKVAKYYGLEEEAVQITWKDD